MKVIQLAVCAVIGGTLKFRGCEARLVETEVYVVMGDEVFHTFHN